MFPTRVGMNRRVYTSWRERAFRNRDRKGLGELSHEHREESRRAAVHASNIVGKFMEPDVKLRYQSAAEIMADLEAWQGGRAAATLHFPSGVRPWGRSYPWHWFGTAAAVVVLAVVGFVFRDKLFKPPPAQPGR